MRKYLDRSAELARPPRKKDVSELLAKKVYDVSQGHPATVAAVDELLWGSKALPGTDPRELLRDLPEQPGERAAALVERLVRDDDALERALWAAAVPRQFDEPLLEHLLADPPLSRHDQDLFDKLKGFKFTEQLPPDENLRLHSYVRNGLLQRMRRKDPKRLDALHALAAEHYMDVLTAKGQDGSPSSYGDMFNYEDPEWQRNKREWLYHRGHATSEDAQLNALLEFTRLFLDAFWWWGNYIHFDFCDQLVTDLAHLAGSRVPKGRRVSKLEALSQDLRCILREYPLRSVKSKGAKWDDVREALLDVRRLCGLQTRDDRQLTKDQRHVAALLLVFLAHTYRYQSPEQPEADQCYSRAANLLAQDEDWSEAWVAFERADLRRERGETDAVPDLWRHAAGLVQPDEVEAASIEIASEAQAAAAQQAKDAVDQELVSNLHRLRGDCCLVSGDEARSATWYGRAVLHAYLFHLVEGPPDDYTLQFYVDIRARALSLLFHVWQRGDQDAAVTLATEMAGAFPVTPGREAGRRPDPVRLLLAGGKPVPLAHALFPRGPEVSELGSEKSPFIKEFNALAWALQQRTSRATHSSNGHQGPARPGVAVTRPGHLRPSFRRLGLLFVGFLVAASVLVLIVWAIPSWLTRELALAEAERYKAMADVRTGLAAALAALGAAGGLAYTARTFRLSQVGQLTGRFESALKQMGDNDQTVRLAGIHAMAQLADGWVEQRQTCVDVLCAFLRVTRPQSDDLREAHRTTLHIITAHLRSGHHQVSWQQCEFDLTGAVLKEADFTGINFAGARFLFEAVHFEENVRFDGAIFKGGCVSFRDAKLLPGSRVSFANAEFRGGKVVFDNVTFGREEASFDNAVFKPRCRVTFQGAQLGNGGIVSFRNATVQGPGLRFEGARFSSPQGLVRFDGATFHGTVHFDKAKFDGVVTFDDVKLGLGKLGLGRVNLVFAGAEWTNGRFSFKGADCTAMTVDLKEPHRGEGSIEFRIDFREADGTPRITPRILACPSWWRDGSVDAVIAAS